ncbi:hypothetical protein TNCV_4653061 [Trichonephila clavipes]|nr:hypothetical protein TNCV_4653061 [Trichonephila clavipes]
MIPIFSLSILDMFGLPWKPGGHGQHPSGRCVLNSSLVPLKTRRVEEFRCTLNLFRLDVLPLVRYLEGVGTSSGVILFP